MHKLWADQTWYFLEYFFILFVTQYRVIEVYEEAFKIYGYFSQIKDFFNALYRF